MDDDLKELMMKCLDIEKKVVQEELHDYACAVVIIVSPTGRHFEHPEFLDEDEKVAAYSAIVKTAKALSATAIVTINAARMGTSEMDTDLEGYWWGKLAAGAKECISITVSGPGMRSLGLIQGYEITDGKVIFDPSPEVEETEVGMLVGWPGDGPKMPS